MIKMIFYTLLTNYPHIDRANIVLTAMIVYIIIYIGVPEEWNTVALTSVAVLDYTLLNGKVWMDKTQGWIKKAQDWMGKAQGWMGKAQGWMNGKTKSKKKTRHHKKKHGNKKRVRFSNVNQYHEYKPWTGWSGDNVVRLNTNASNAVRVPSTSNASKASNASNFNVPSWQLTPQQQLQKLLMKKAAASANLNLNSSSGMIDNRHLIIKDDEKDRFLQYDDESVDSDLSSDLSNSEEGFDF